MCLDGMGETKTSDALDIVDKNHVSEINDFIFDWTMVHWTRLEATVP
jgi:hypothetical protein